MDYQLRWEGRMKAGENSERKRNGKKLTHHHDARIDAGKDVAGQLGHSGFGRIRRLPDFVPVAVRIGNPFSVGLWKREKEKEKKVAKKEINRMNGGAEIIKAEKNLRRV